MASAEHEAMTADDVSGDTGNYAVIRQSVREVRDPENSPSVSMAAYLVETRQEDLFRELSVYVERGTSREEIRRLYMNAVALRIWRDMGKVADVVGQRDRPPPGAELGFGVPFSE